MGDLANLFDKETVENISNLIENKMHILNNVPEFKEKDQSLADATEKLEDALSEDLSDQFDDVMRLHYQVEEYYYTLAYFLGKQHAEQITKL